MSALGTTPGPWVASVKPKPFGTRGHWYVVTDAEENGLGEFYGDDHEANTANVRLAAAAPDLFEKLASAIKKLRTCTVNGGTNPEYADIMLEPYIAALAKARGEA